MKVKTAESNTCSKINPKQERPKLRLSKPFNLKLPRIRCRCGAEILVVPNVEAMSKAIEAHVEEHKKTIKNHKEARKEAGRVRDELIEKVLMQICEL